MSKTLPSYVTGSGDTIKLTGTSSMPCASWSLPAVNSCPGSKVSVRALGDEAVCNECYATKGFYRMGNVQDAQQSRMNWVTESLQENDGAELVTGLVRMITDDVAKRGEPIFRVHDSGDLFSVAYIRAWIAIAETLPDVQFWVPTRSHIVPSLLDSILSLAALPNVVVRPSGLAFDELPPVVPGLAAGTTVIRSLPVLQDMPGVKLCPKTDPNDGRSNCEDCRNCWEGSDPIAYFVH